MTTNKPRLSPEQLRANLLSETVQAQQRVIETYRNHYNKVIQRIFDTICSGHERMNIILPLSGDGFPSLEAIDQASDAICGCIDPSCHPDVDLCFGLGEKQSLERFPVGWKIEDAAIILAKELAWPLDKVRFTTGEDLSKRNLSTDGRYKIMYMLSISGYKMEQLANLFGGISFFTVRTLLESCQRQYTSDKKAWLQISDILERIPALVENYNLI